MQKRRMIDLKQFVYTVTSPVGIHARPAGFLVKEAKKYQSKILLCGKDGKYANATQLLAVMNLGIKRDEQVMVTIEGTDEELAALQLEAFFRKHL